MTKEQAQKLATKKLSQANTALKLALKEAGALAEEHKFIIQYRAPVPTGDNGGATYYPKGMAKEMFGNDGPDYAEYYDDWVGWMSSSSQC